MPRVFTNDWQKHVSASLKQGTGWRCIVSTHRNSLLPLESAPWKKCQGLKEGCC